MTKRSWSCPPESRCVLSIVRYDSGRLSKRSSAAFLTLWDSVMSCSSFEMSVLGYDIPVMY